MFSLDKWQEIFHTMGKNRLRTVLTGISVIWGIFMLIVLLGAGQGLENGVTEAFRDDAINSVWISSGQTSIPHQGLKSGRNIRFTNFDHDQIEGIIDSSYHITSRFNKWGTSVNYKDKGGNFSIRGTHPSHVHLENSEMTAGRFVNDIDLKEFRKIAVIGKGVVEQLYGDENPIGTYIRMAGLPFLVVGTYRDSGGENEEARIYIPVSTAQKVFNGGQRVNQIMFTTGDLSVAQSEDLSDKAHQYLANRHKFSVADSRAVYVNNNNKQFEEVMMIITGIKVFVWVMGIFTIIAGIAGVSNIMLISVKERTREFGVRKALGASPASIVSLIIMEAVILTSAAGYLGILAGVFLLESLAPFFQETQMFTNPTVPMSTILYATAVLIVAGALAGFIPARRAARVRPIVALRDE